MRSTDLPPTRDTRGAPGSAPVSPSGAPLGERRRRLLVDASLVLVLIAIVVLAITLLAPPAA